MSAVAINIEKKNVKCGRMQLVSVENYIVKSTVFKDDICIVYRIFQSLVLK